MAWQITLKNYRCFPDSDPARFIIAPRSTAFIGANNSGKSSILKFFYEFRNLFQAFYPGNMNSFNQSLNGNPYGINLPGEILDPNEVFSNLNDRDIVIEFEQLTPTQGADSSIKPLTRLQFTMMRGTKSVTAAVWVDGQRYKSNDFRNNDVILMDKGDTITDLTPIIDCFRTLAKTIYIGPFRNAIHTGTQDSYYDIQIGQAFVERWRAWKTGHIIRDTEAANQVTSDLERIFGFNRLEINAAADDRTLQLIIDGKVYRLPSLGSGISQFIVVLDLVQQVPRT